MVFHSTFYIEAMSFELLTGKFKRLVDDESKKSRFVVVSELFETEMIGNKMFGVKGTIYSNL